MAQTLQQLLAQRALSGYGFNPGGAPNFSGFNFAQQLPRYQSDTTLPTDFGGSEDAGAAQAAANAKRNFSSDPNSYGYGGYDIFPMANGMYGVAKYQSGAKNGPGMGVFPNQPMDVYNAQGQFQGRATTPSTFDPTDNSMQQFMIGAGFMGVGALGALGAFGAAGAGAGGGAGTSLAGGSGIGSGYGASLTGGMGGASLPAGAGFTGSGALDAAGIGSAGYGSGFGLGAGNAALDSAAASGMSAAAGGAGGGGAGSSVGGGVPPNPNIPASSNVLSNLPAPLGSALSNLGGTAISGLVGGALAGGTNPSGGQASAYIPTARPQFDQNFQNYYGQYGNTLNNIQGQTGPASQQVFGNQFNNQYAPGFQTSANQAGQVYGQQAGQAAGGANTLYGAGNQLYQMAFDPMQSQYNRARDQLVENTRAGEYARGIAMTPYGAAVEGDTLGQFQNDWQNQQLQRAESGLNAAGTAFRGGATLGNTAGAMTLASGQTPYDASNTVYGNQANAINTYWGANSPYFTGNNQLQSNALGYINNANSAANMGFNQNQTNNQNAWNVAQSISGPISQAISSGFGNLWSGGTGYPSSSWVPDSSSGFGTGYQYGNQDYGQYF